MRTVFYDYKECKEFMDKVNELTNGNYYTKGWQGYLNYYNGETDERIGYEAIMDGYYLIVKDDKVDNIYERSDVVVIH